MKNSFLLFFALIACWAAPCGAQENRVPVLFLKGDHQSSAAAGLRTLSLSGVTAETDEVFYLSGLSCLKNGDYANAAKLFNKVIKDFRRSEYIDEARIGLADSMYLKGDITGARKKYEQFLVARPSSGLKAGVYYRLYLLEKKARRAAEARSYKDKLKSDFPRSFEASMDKDIFPVVSVADENRPVVNSRNASLAGYSIQVGAFSKRVNAERLSQRLSLQGYSPYIEDLLSGGRRIYKVRVGPVGRFPDARALQRRLTADGYPTRLDSR